MADVFMVKDALEAGMTPDQIHEFVTAYGLQADTSGVAARHATFARQLGASHAGQTVRVKRSLTVPQQITKTVADATPGALSGVGAVAGFGTGNVPGAVVGGTLGGMYGQSGKEALYGLAGIPTDQNPMQMAGRMAGSGAEGLVNGLFQGVGGAPRPGLAVGAMKSAVGDAQPMVEQKLVERDVPLTREGLVKAKKGMEAARAEKKALIEWATGPEGVRVSWKHFRETLTGALRNAQESDPLSHVNDTALTKAIANARYKMATLFSRSARARGEQAFTGADSEDAILTPQQVERIRRYADNQVSFYENARLGKRAAGPTAEPSPMEGAYRAIADRARAILNQITDPATGRSLEQINRDIGDFADIHETVTKALKRGGMRDVATASAATAPSLAYGLWQNDPAAIGLSLATPMAAYVATNPQAKSRLALALARKSMGRGLAAQAVPQAIEGIGTMSGLLSPELNRGVTTYTSPDQTRR